MNTQEKAEEHEDKSGDFDSSSAYTLDKIEREIIAQLAEDGRKPFQSIARELNVDEKTIRNRYAKLRSRGLLRIIPTTGENQLSECIGAVFGVNVSEEYRTRVAEVAQAIAALPMVSWAGAVLGRFDLLVEVCAASREALAQFQLSLLPLIPGVADIEGFVVLSNHGKRGLPYVDGTLNPS